MTYKEFQQKKASDGDSIYWQVFDEYCAYVHTIVFNALRSCGTKEDIEECVTDIFADVYRFFNSSTEREGDIKGFIGTVAKRKALRFRNRLIYHSENTVSDDEGDILNSVSSDENIEESVSDNEVQRILIDKVYELGEPDSTIVIQKYYFNKTSSEISKLVALSPAMVRLRCSRALKKLRNLLKSTGIQFQEQ